MLNLHIEDLPLARIVSLIGELNTQTCTTLYRLLDERFQLHVQHVVLDLSEISELTSSAQKIIFDSHRRSISDQSDKRISFCNLNEEIEQLIKMTGLSKFIPVFPSVEIALQTIESTSH